MSSVLVPSFFGSGKILTHIHEPADNSARLIVTSDFTICVSAWNFTTCQLDSRHITLWTVSSDILDCQDEKDCLTKILTFYYFCFVSFKIFDSAYFSSPNCVHGLFSCPCISGSYTVIKEVSILCHRICKSLLLNVCWDVPICVTLMRSDAHRGVFPPKIWHQGECNRSDI